MAIAPARRRRLRHDAAPAPNHFHPTEPIPGYLIRERLGAADMARSGKPRRRAGLPRPSRSSTAAATTSARPRELGLAEPHQGGPPSVPAVAGADRTRRRPPDHRHRAGHGSLKQEFDKCREAGLPGIPRDELLSHLHDAADALDYISQQHCLQHLDVKPENLLLVGGRVKVADFGLVKDLQDVAARSSAA